MSTTQTLDEILSDTRIDSRDLVDLRASLDLEDSEEKTEAERIDAILEELQGEDRPEDGVFLIRESFWVEYAQELAEDIGAINADAGWPNNCIDWARAADELAMDYTSIDIDGVSYYYR